MTSNDWVYYNLVHRDLRKHIKGGTRDKLNQGDLRQVQLPFPPKDVQRRIAALLDTVDAAIRETDAVIAKQEQVKTGLLQDLLTRGLDADGRLRDPARHPEQFRATALGRLPKDWSVACLSELLVRRPRNGYSPKQLDEWTGVLMLGLGCLKPEGFEPIQLKNAPADDNKIGRALLEDGDLLVSRSNTRERVALAGIYRDVGAPCIYPDLMMRIESNGRTTNRFLELLLRHQPVRRQLTRSAQGTSGSMVKINSSMLLNTKVPVISRNEQRRILEMYDEKDHLISIERDYRDKLQRLKTGLMQDLLTGRKRVPEIADQVAEAVA